MKTEPNQLVYPCDGQYAGEARSNNDDGLTKREHMAIEFTKAFLSNPSITEHHRIDDTFYKDTVRQAIFVTDELIKQLNEK